MTPEQVAAQLAQRAQQNPEIAAFLTNGTFAGLSQSTQNEIMRALNGTPYANSPGGFYTAIKATTAAKTNAQGNNTGAVTGREDHRGQTPVAPGASNPTGLVSNQTGAPEFGGNDPGLLPPSATPAGPPSPPPVAPPPSAMPNTGAGPTTQPDTGPGSPGNLQNIALSGDQNFAFSKMMDMLGLAPGQQGAFGGSIAKTLLPLFQAYFGLNGLQGDGTTNAVDNSSKALNGFAGMVNGEQGLMGQLQGYANSSLGNINAMGDKLSDPNEQQRYMDMALALSTAGENPLVRQAMADENTRAQYGFDKASFDGLGTPTGPKNYIKWLQGQGADQSNYSDIIRLFGGK